MCWGFVVVECRRHYAVQRLRLRGIHATSRTGSAWNANLRRSLDAGNEAGIKGRPVILPSAARPSSSSTSSVTRLLQIELLVGSRSQDFPHRSTVYVLLVALPLGALKGSVRDRLGSIPQIVECRPVLVRHCQHHVVVGGGPGVRSVDRIIGDKTGGLLRFQVGLVRRIEVLHVSVEHARLGTDIRDSDYWSFTIGASRLRGGRVRGGCGAHDR